MTGMQEIRQAFARDWELGGAQVDEARDGCGGPRWRERRARLLQPQPWIPALQEWRILPISAQQERGSETITQQEEGLCSWLIKGDFDHFKLTNDLYGALIADYLLDWTLEVIEAEIGLAQEWLGCGALMCSLVGDDVTVYIPPSGQGAEDIERLLWKMRAAIEESFRQRYRVGVLPLAADFFEDVSPAALEQMRGDLERIDVVFDFAARQRGFLILYPVGRDGKTWPVQERVMWTIQHRTGKAVPFMEVQPDWISHAENPADGTARSFEDEPAGCTFNEGFLDPPTVSFAAYPARMSAEGQPVFEQVSLACQAALKVCKQQRRGVYIPADGEAFLDLLAQPANVPGCEVPKSGALNRVRWASERYLRETLYFRPLEQPVLFQVNPVYDLAEGLPAEILHSEQYRGNGYGVGLKGINTLCGQNTADRMIRQLMAIFSAKMRDALEEKGIPAEGVWLAQFVDRFTVCCEQPVFAIAEIVELARDVAGQFNALSETVKVSQMRASVVMGGKNLLGYRLFHQLALTVLAAGNAALVDADPPIEVRRNSAPALREGRAALERGAYASAKLLAEYEQVVFQAGDGGYAGIIPCLGVVFR